MVQGKIIYHTEDTSPYFPINAKAPRFTSERLFTNLSIGISFKVKKIIMY